MVCVNEAATELDCLDCDLRLPRILEIPLHSPKGKQQYAYRAIGVYGINEKPISEFQMLLYRTLKIMPSQLRKEMECYDDRMRYLVADTLTLYQKYGVARRYQVSFNDFAVLEPKVKKTLVRNCMEDIEWPGH